MCSPRIVSAHVHTEAYREGVEAVVDVQMGAEYVVDVLEPQTSGAEAVQPTTTQHQQSRVSSW
jgi:hypothetical protein